ncbi:MAG TPA: hypothetical protein VMB25_17830, partial [Bryobacteraceae bacterium]|nr:hypothetical protein [Bryobacteraceae bacterium]
MKTLLTSAAIPILVGAIYAQGGADDSQARPPVSQADIQIVRRAREILNSPAVWNRADTRECPAAETKFSLYCALEKATEESGVRFQHRGAAMQEARFVIDDLAPNRHYPHRLMGYNNDPNTTFADIQKVFTLLETRIAGRLQDGQNAAADLKTQIAILRRVRTLLDSEAKWDRHSSQDCPPEAPAFGLFCAFQRA